MVTNLRAAIMALLTLLVIGATVATAKTSLTKFTACGGKGGEWYARTGITLGFMIALTLLIALAEWVIQKSKPAIADRAKVAIRTTCGITVLVVVIHSFMAINPVFGNCTVDEIKSAAGWLAIANAMIFIEFSLLCLAAIHFAEKKLP